MAWGIRVTRRLWAFCLLAGLALASLAGATGGASAETYTFKMRNLASPVIELRFHSTSREASWPAGGRVWNMTTADVKNYKLNCRAGEQICYGGSGDGNEWGVGRDNTQTCRSCCYICRAGGSTRVIDLTD